MQIKAIKTRIFQENEDLFKFIFEYVKKLKENSILIVTSKIVALSEGRTVKYENEKQKIKFIKKESDLAIKTKIVWLTIKDGMLLASAGIDDSSCSLLGICSNGDSNGLRRGSATAAGNRRHWGLDHVNLADAAGHPSRLPLVRQRAGRR